MKVTLRQFNHGLSVVVIILCLYVIAGPYLPMFTQKFRPTPELVQSEEKNEKPQKPPAHNTLVIPRLKLQEQIHENGVPAWGLAKGVWRDFRGSSPDLGKNTILSGHRFTYAGKSVFYNLDKVKKGDRIVVWWNRKRIEYKVVEIREVAPTDKEVTKQGDDAVLTIYTCTPLITAQNRLIVRAEPVEEETP